MPVDNLFPAWAPFSRRPQHRHLFRQYWRASARRPTLFTPRQRLELVQSLLETLFNFGKLRPNFHELPKFRAKRNRGLARWLKACGFRGRGGEASVPGLVVRVQALHDASRGDLTIGLLRSLATPLLSGSDAASNQARKERPKEVEKWDGGEVLVTDQMDGGGCCFTALFAVRRVLFAQQLHLLNHYYGSRIALFFAFVGFYTYGLLFLALGGVLLYLIEAGDTYGLELPYFGWLFSDLAVDILWVLYLASVFVWMGYFRSGWDRQASFAALKWGAQGAPGGRSTLASLLSVATLATGGKQAGAGVAHGTDGGKGHGRAAASGAGMRPEFVSTNKTFRSPVTRRRELAEDVAHQRHWFWVTLVMVWGMVFARLAISAVIIELCTWNQAYKQVLSALITNVLSTRPVFKLIEFMTEMENYKLRADFENSCAIKLLLFQFVNWYGMLSYLLVRKMRTHEVPNKNLLTIELQCICLLVTRLGFTIGSVFSHYVSARYCTRNGRKGSGFEGGSTTTTAASSAQPLLDDTPDDTLTALSDRGTIESTIDDELDLLEPGRDDLFHEYLRLSIQFGMVALMSASFQLTAGIVLVENLLYLRFNAYTLTALQQRPAPAPAASGIGVWGAVLDGIAVFASAWSAWTIVFDSTYCNGYSTAIHWILFLVVTFVYAGLYIGIRMLRPGISEVDVATARNSVVSERHLGAVR